MSSRKTNFSSISKEQSPSDVDRSMKIQKTKKEDVWKKPSTERMITGGLWYNIFDILGTIANTIFIMTISRLPTSNTAFLARIESFRAFLLTFAALGFVGAGGKFYSEYLGRGDLRQAIIYGRASIRYNFLFTGLPIIFLSIFAFFTLPTSEEEKIGFFLLIFIVSFDRIRSCFDIILLGYQRYDYWAISLFVPTILAYTLGSGFIYKIGVIGALWGFLIASFSSLLLSFIFTLKIIPYSIRELIIGPVEKGLFRKILGFNVLYALANIAYSLLIGSLLISEGSILGTLSDFEISTYYVVSGYLTLYIGIFGLVNPINQAISEAHAMRNKYLMDNYIQTLIKFPILMAVPVTAVLIILGPDLILTMNGEKYVQIGYFMLLVFLPGYALGTFASKYDNVLAGIGRPEVPMMPWVVGLSVASLGIASTLWIPENIFPFPLFPQVSLRFCVALLSLTLGLFIAGVWIIYQTIQIFEIKVPSEYFIIPFLVSVIVAVVYFLIKSFFDLKSWLLGLFNEFLASFLYLVITMSFLLVLFIPLLILFGGIGREDALFIRRILPPFPMIGLIEKIVSFCLKYQIIHTKEVHWITREDLSLQQASTFDVVITSPLIFLDKAGLYNLRIDVKIINKSSSDLFDLLVYFKYKGKKITDNSFIFIKEEVVGKENLSISFSFSIGELLKVLDLSSTPLSTEEEVEEALSSLFTETNPLLLCVECFSKKHPYLKTEELFSGWFWKLVDYRLKWYYEKEILPM